MTSCLRYYILRTGGSSKNLKWPKYNRRSFEQDCRNFQNFGGDIGFNIWQKLAGSNPHVPICSDGPVEVIWERSFCFLSWHKNWAGRCWPPGYPGFRRSYIWLDKRYVCGVYGGNWVGIVVYHQNILVGFNKAVFDNFWSSLIIWMNNRWGSFKFGKTMCLEEKNEIKRQHKLNT